MNLENVNYKICDSAYVYSWSSVRDSAWNSVMDSVWGVVWASVDHPMSNSVGDSVDFGLQRPIREERSQG
jgi:hypothetical protein